jgi:hypothetical protein
MYCKIRTPDYSGITIIEITPERQVSNYMEARKIADEKAKEQLGEFMLLSWYDRDRDFEAPQHTTECHEDSAIPGYVDYGLNHGATVKVDIEQGRFVFFYTPVEL